MKKVISLIVCAALLTLSTTVMAVGFNPPTSDSDLTVYIIIGAVAVLLIVGAIVLPKFMKK